MISLAPTQWKTLQRTLASSRSVDMMVCRPRVATIAPIAPIAPIGGSSVSRVGGGLVSGESVVFARGHLGGVRGIRGVRGVRGVNTTTRASNTSNPSFALLFDCDGVLVETEELHRLAYNASFQYFQIHIDGSQCDWPPEYYDVLANTVGGGKPKMRWHFGQTNWPVVMNPELAGAYPNTLTDEATQDRLIDDLQDKKTEFYKKIVDEVAEAREGILELMDEAIADPDIAVGICSAATKAGFEKVVNSVVGKDRLACMDVLMAGDDVTKKKPDPLIYNLARERLGLPAEKCVVIEDSIVGLRAAMGAGMTCIITPCGSTMGQDFIGEGASFVCEPTVAASGVTLRKIFPAGAESPNFEF